MADDVDIFGSISESGVNMPKDIVVEHFEKYVGTYSKVKDAYDDKLHNMPAIINFLKEMNRIRVLDIGGGVETS